MTKTKRSLDIVEFFNLMKRVNNSNGTGKKPEINLGLHLISFVSKICIDTGGVESFTGTGWSVVPQHKLKKERRRGCWLDSDLGQLRQTLYKV